MGRAFSLVLTLFNGYVELDVLAVELLQDCLTLLW